MVVSSATAPAEPQADPVIPEVDYGQEGVDHGTLEQFATFCQRNIMVGDPARPLILEPFQRRILTDYFNGVPETLILLPKGNGKSTLLAALALYHLAVVPFADVKIVASSRPAAEQIFEFAHSMVEASPRLKKLFKVTASTREIRTRKGLGRLKALPAETKSIDGKAPTLVLADELHHWDKPEVYAFLAGGLGKRGGRLFGITTAGADLASFLGKMRAKILEYIVEKSGCYVYAATPDGQFALHEWSVPQDGDPDDMELVKQANPLAAISQESLQRKRDSPSTIFTLWCRLHANQWVQDGDAALDQGEWAALERLGCEIPAGAQVIVAADFGWRKDTTALIPLGIVSHSPLIIRVDRRLRIIHPPGAGRSTKPEAVKQAFRDLHAIFPHMIVALDPNAEGRLMAEWLSDDLGVLVVEQSQEPTPMAHGASLVSELVRDGRWEHPGNEEYTRQMVNAPAVSISRDGSKWRFGKHDVVPNDSAVASAIGARQADVLEEEEGPQLAVIY